MLLYFSVKCICKLEAKYIDLPALGIHVVRQIGVTIVGLYIEA